MKRIYTMTQVARVLRMKRQRAQVLHAAGRLPHDIEDQDGRPYWSRPPERPKPQRSGRKPRST